MDCWLLAEGYRNEVRNPHREQAGATSTAWASAVRANLEGMAAIQGERHLSQYDERAMSAMSWNHSTPDEERIKNQLKNLVALCRALSLSLSLSTCLSACVSISPFLCFSDSLSLSLSLSIYLYIYIYMHCRISLVAKSSPFLSPCRAKRKLSQKCVQASGEHLGPRIGHHINSRWATILT